MVSKTKVRALRAAFPHTLPILTGYLFLGFTLGILARTSGLPAWFPVLTACAVYAGSAEFVTVGLLSEPFHPLQTFMIILMLNARHLFYGISMLEKYRDIRGFHKFSLIYGLSDETFSVNCSADIPDDVDREWFYYYVTQLDHLYWIVGAAAGAVAGMHFPFSTEGLDFVMTAMFAVIFLEQLQKKENRPTAVIGAAVSLICLILFGADHFLLPAMLGIILCLAVGKKPIDCYYSRCTETAKPAVQADHTGNGGAA